MPLKDMKTTKFAFLILLCYFLNLKQCNAQDSIVLSKKLTLNNIDDLKLYFQDNFNPGEDYIAHACIKCAVFIKFSVLANGKVDSIDISKGAPAQIKEALKKAIIATNGFWEKSLSGKTLLVPVLCLYQNGCTPGVLDTFPKKAANLKEAFKPDIIKGRFILSVTDLLEFDSKNFSTLNCILTHPFTVGTMQ